MFALRFLSAASCFIFVVYANDECEQMAKFVLNVAENSDKLLDVRVESVAFIGQFCSSNVRFFETFFFRSGKSVKFLNDETEISDDEELLIVSLTG